MEKVGPWSYFESQFKGKSTSDIVSYLETYPSHVIVDPPTDRRFGGAFHQDEGVSFQSTTGEKFVLVPDGSLVYKKDGISIYTGDCYREDEFNLPHERGCLLVTEPDDDTRTSKFYRLGRFFGDEVFPVFTYQNIAVLCQCFN